jgi:hypothetical protein
VVSLVVVPGILMWATTYPKHPIQVRVEQQLMVVIPKVLELAVVAVPGVPETLARAIHLAVLVSLALSLEQVRTMAAVVAVQSMVALRRGLALAVSVVVVKAQTVRL